LIARDAADLSYSIGRIVVEKHVQFIPALGSRGDEARIQFPGIAYQAKQPVHQREIGSWFDREMNVGHFRGGGAARIDHDAFRLAAPEPLDHAIERHRMAVGRVGADEEKRVGEFDIGVATGRAVAAERERHPTGRAGHAQPAVAVDVIGPQAAFGELGCQVLRFGRKLAG
jgi:hypothetical protein